MGTIIKQREFRLVECAQINPHSENAPDTGGGVTSHIEQVSYLSVAKMPNNKKGHRKNWQHYL